MSDAKLDWSAGDHARSQDGATSHAAARTMRAAAKLLCDRIYADIVQNGPGTFSAIATRMKLEPAQVWRRLSDLKNSELIEPSGKTERGDTGRRQTVWQLRHTEGSL